MRYKLGKEVVPRGLPVGLNRACPTETLNMAVDDGLLTPRCKEGRQVFWEYRRACEGCAALATNTPSDSQMLDTSLLKLTVVALGSQPPNPYDQETKAGKKQAARFRDR